MKANTFFVLDLETGGRDQYANPITEIGICVVDGDTLQVIEEYESLIKPYEDLEILPEAIELTGHTVKKLERDGANAADVIKDIKQLAKKHRVGKYDISYPIIVAHNSAFERNFLQAFFAMHDEDLYDHFTSYMQDTLYMALQIWGDTGSVKLVNCLEKAGLVVYDAHTALADARATKDLFIYFLAQLRNDTDIKIGSADTPSFRESFKFEF